MTEPTSKPARTMNRLSDDQTVDFILWMRANKPLIPTMGTYQAVAEKASAALGFTVTDGNVRGRMERMGIEFPSKPPVNGQELADAKARIETLEQAIAPLVRRVMHLEDIVDQFMLSFVNQASRQQLIKIRDAHQTFVVSVKEGQS